MNRIVIHQDNTPGAKRPYTAEVDGTLLVSESGKVSRFASYRAANTKSLRRVKENDEDTALRAKYSKEPRPATTRTLGGMISRTFR